MSTLSKDLPTLLFDTNVLMDCFTKRQPFDEAATHLINLVELRHIKGFLCASSVTTLYYLLQRYADKSFAEQKLSLVLELFAIAPVDKTVLVHANETQAKDFEDAVIFCSADAANVKAIVTRNIKDFKKSSIPVYTPTEALTWALS